MSIKTLEFTKSDGRKVTINPASVTHVEQTPLFNAAPGDYGHPPEGTAIGCFGYFIYLDEKYEDVTKKIWGA